ncbi:hypothetical protein U1737_18325 [Sphingomonas sp. LB3N6]|uniref:hypothetical protein n=1 Tax=Sphingomonas fucosidasi TaxID=3096164 RepID=UPI002FC766FC
MAGPTPARQTAQALAPDAAHMDGIVARRACAGARTNFPESTRHSANMIVSAHDLEP